MLGKLFAKNLNKKDMNIRLINLEVSNYCGLMQSVGLIGMLNFSTKAVNSSIKPIIIKKRDILDTLTAYKAENNTFNIMNIDK